MTRAPFVVIGVGNPMRGDDGLGPAVVEALATEAKATDLLAGPTGAVEFVTVGGETTELLDAWSDRRLALVVDAVRSGATAGTVHRLDADGPGLGPTWSAGVSGHGVGLVEAIGLARALDRLPERLVLLGVEVANTGFGSQLSPVVQAAMPELLARIRAELATTESNA